MKYKGGGERMEYKNEHDIQFSERTNTLVDRFKNGELNDPTYRIFNIDLACVEHLLTHKEWPMLKDLNRLSHLILDDRLVDAGQSKLGQDKFEEPSDDIQYAEPGGGAVEFAKEHIKVRRDDAISEIQRLLEGCLHDPSDKKIKRCAYCGYWFRDKTKNNSGKVCSKECRDARNIVNRTKKRRTAKPPAPTLRDKYYYETPEFSYWLHEWAMRNDAKRLETLHSPHKLESIDAAKQRDAKLGGKRKPKYVVSYNGDEEGKTNHKVSVRMSENKEARKPSEVTTINMGTDKLQEYYEGNYSERTRQLARHRAQTFLTVEKF